MKKIPTLFERDWGGDRSRVVNQVNPGCEWVLAGDGIATRKLDGSCCMIRSGVLYKRRELKPGSQLPPDFEEADFDDETGKRVGWIPVGDGPEDKYHREAFSLSTDWLDGTYELTGPKVQGGAERAPAHILVPHGRELAGPIDGVPRDFDGLAAFFTGKDIEGIVFHHPDGRRAKIKLRDFGLKRGQ